MPVDVLNNTTTKPIDIAIEAFLESRKADWQDLIEHLTKLRDAVIGDGILCYQLNTHVESTLQFWRLRSTCPCLSTHDVIMDNPTSTLAYMDSFKVLVCLAKRLLTPLALASVVLFLEYYQLMQGLLEEHLQPACLLTLV